MTDPVLAIATVPGVVALVELAKRLGLPVSLAPLAAVLLGVGAQMLTVASQGGSYMQALSAGLILGLSAAGLWDVAGRVKPVASTVDQSPVVPATAPEVIGV